MGVTNLLVLFSTLQLTIIVTSQNPPHACDPSSPSTHTYPFCNETLPINQRVRDLVTRLTLDEKISQLVNSAPSIPRLGIPDYQWWSEALHGVSYSYGIDLFNGSIKSATSFPQVILTAASFDAQLWYRIGQAIGVEARAIYNAGQAKGMTFWAPNINIFRDPRWGRGQETPGEDPKMSGQYAVSFVRGFQGDSFEGRKSNQKILQASACCKHFTAYDLEKSNGVSRYNFNAIVSQQDLAETYQPPFQACVQQGKASGIMCSYNQVNGVPTCADYNLLSVTARQQWGFHGYIVSDCDAVAIIYEAQRYAKSPEDAVVDVLRAGLDVNCGKYLQEHTKSAIGRKKLPVYHIDRAVSDLFSIRMLLGLFNGKPAKQPFGKIGQNQVCTAEHQALALDAARNGIVLLKNSANLLPLGKSTKTTVAIMGPHANSSRALLGNYAGPGCNIVTPHQAMKSYVPNTVLYSGCDTVDCSSVNIDKAVEIAKTVQHVILVMGLDETQEKETLDRLQLTLPGNQQRLISSVSSAARNPIILVLVCGGPVDITFANNDKKIGSILWAGYPGEAGGTALAEILFGDHNPGGKLPVTWYPEDFIKVPMTDMRMRPDPSSGYPGRTYRFYNGRKVFEFGYGLSYSKYNYSFVSSKQNKLYLNQSTVTQKDNNNEAGGFKLISELNTEFCQHKKFTATVRVTNRGDLMGKHPVLLFARKEKPGSGGPMKQLVAFQSVKLKAGEGTKVEFPFNPCEQLSRANEDGLMGIEGGSYILNVGDVEHPLTVFV